MTSIEEIVKSANPSINVCQFYDLINYDSNMELLYSNIKNYLDNKFNGNTCFANNDRIVFFHYDHDFFLNKNLPGLTLYNLQLILRELDVPNYFCRIITNLPNYEHYTKLAQQQLTSDPCHIKSITSSLFHINQIKDIELNVNQIQRPFVVGSRLSRFHRTFFVSKIFHKQLENVGFVNYYNILAENDQSQHVSAEDTTLKTPCTFLYSSPFNRNNPEVIIRHENNRRIVGDFQNLFNSFTNLKDDNLSDKHYAAKQHQGLAFQQALVYVGLESVINCPEPFINEISFKGIQIKRPFIIFGTKGVIKHLKSLGFKTFDQYWSEEYDNIDDMESRVDAIIDILENLPINQMQDLIQDMLPILEYNFNHYKNYFAAQELKKISIGL